MIAHAPFSPPSNPDTPSQLRAIANSRSYDYLVSRPSNATAHPGPGWPLIVFLHGAGERGNSVIDVARHGLPRLLDGNPELTAVERSVARDIAERCVIVAPQCAHYEVWNETLLLALIDEVSASLNVDPARVYLTGLSLGGFGVWSLGMRHPERFAALVPICGGGRIRDVTTAATNHGAALQRLGIWAFHGAKDRVVPVEESERMIAALKHAGMSEVKFTIYPDAEHDAWTMTYADPKLYRWMLRHRQEIR